MKNILIVNAASIALSLTAILIGVFAIVFRGHDHGVSGWADVRDHGARGITLQTTRQRFRLHIDTGRRVYVPKGRYMVSTLDVSADDTIVAGDGMGQSTFVALGSGPAFNISGQRPELKDFTIDWQL